ncbi:MAG: hypothetical protein CMH52_02180 [Myxococcales bacterium]|nr:hypothetical protein [Myxococcales bacterium]
MELKTPICGLVLSAGESQRMGQPKALLTVQDTPLIVKAVSTLDQVCDVVVVAAGRHYQQINESSQARIAVHRVVDWRHGMRASLRSALNALPGGHILVCHIDQPGIKQGTLERLCSGHINRPRVLTYRGRTGHPVLVPDWLRPVIIRHDRRSLRQIFNHVGFEKIDVDDVAITRNLNRREDWKRFLFEFRS